MHRSVQRRRLLSAAAAALALGGSAVAFPEAVAAAGPIAQCAPDALDDPLSCLACNIYHEARGESEEGQLAVAMVTLNRVRSPQYPADVCRVVWQKGTDRRSGAMVAQFSWTLDEHPDTVHNHRAWDQARTLAARALTMAERGAPDPSDGATHFHAHYVDPYWARGPEMSFLTRIGAHLFYRADGQGGGQGERLAHLSRSPPPPKAATVAQRPPPTRPPIPATLDEARETLASAAVGRGKLIRLAAWMEGGQPWEGFSGKRVRLGGDGRAAP